MISAKGEMGNHPQLFNSAEKVRLCRRDGDEENFDSTRPDSSRNWEYAWNGCIYNGRNSGEKRRPSYAHLLHISWGGLHTIR